ncbi:MAG: aspartate kinase [Thermoguttaceae bacterium]
MSLIVQKFGGTSVADTEKIKSAARKAIRATLEGHKVVMVVSAMGKTTDHLIALANELTDNPSTREMDMLMSTGEQVTIALMAIALQSLGHQAVSMTGAQMGIKTDSSHMKARIQSISTERLHKALNDGNIVIAAGFQGIDDQFEITTLGRGGSDTTAVALAAALGADVCEIYTDVDGVYTTDPRILPEARKVPNISFDEMLELASLGAGVMHSRSIEFAKKFGITVHVRSSFSDTTGTLITAEPESRNVDVCGAAIAKTETRFTVIGVPDKPGVAMKLFAQLAEAKIATDMIVQNVSSEGKTDISFTVPGSDVKLTSAIAKKVIEEIGAGGLEIDESVAKISVVGLGMPTRHGVAKKMFRAIADKEINIQMISTSEIKISVLVPREQGTEALRAVHEAFELHNEPPVEDQTVSQATSQTADSGSTKSTLTQEQLIIRLGGMEDIIIDQVSLDQTQARITICGLLDLPGLAARVFERVAQGAIVVDMIVQSAANEGKANISFTVPRTDLPKALAISEELAGDFGTLPPMHNPAIAKLSVFGTGLRSHTGLAYRMFKTMADAGINVNIINTSEMCVDITVDDCDGQKGYELLRNEFAKEIVV